MSGKLPLQFYTRYGLWFAYAVLALLLFGVFSRFIPGEIGVVTRAAGKHFPCGLRLKLYDGAWRIFQALRICAGNLGLHKNEIAKNRDF